VMEPEATRLKQGQRVWLPEAEALGETEAVLITHAAQPLGLFRIEHGVLKTIRMFNIDARS
jgi:Pseudouridine synthase II TruB, C-terminal